MRQPGTYKFLMPSLFLLTVMLAAVLWKGAPASAQLTDRTQNPNNINF
jgi:hypothetical protein